MILITGGLGFIGAHTVNAFINQGYNCIATCHQNKDIPSFLTQYVKRQLFVETVDINNLKSLEVVAKKYNITHVVHLAAPKIGSLGIIEDIRTNINGLLNILELGRNIQPEKIVIASSMGVYESGSPKLKENDSISTSGMHSIAANKKCFEILGDVVAGNENENIVFIRPSAIWGPLGRLKSIFSHLPQMVVAALKGDTSENVLGKVYANDGIDMCYAPDCGEAIAYLTLASNLNYRTYNIGSGFVITNQNIADTLNKILPTAHFSLEPGHKPGSSFNYYLDIERLKTDTGFTPKYNLESGLNDYINWLSSFI